MKSILSLVLFSVLLLASNGVAIAQGTMLWRVEAGNQIFFVERLGFQDNTELYAPLDLSEYPRTCSVNSVVGQLSIFGDNVKSITSNYTPAHTESILQMRLKDNTYCYNERNASWKLKWQGGMQSLDFFETDFFKNSIPVTVVLPTTGEKQRAWIPLLWLSFIQTISFQDAKNLETKWPPPTNPNSKKPAEALKKLMETTDRNLTEFRNNLSMTEPLTNCGWYVSKSEQLVEVTQSGKKSTVPISKIFPNGYPCDP
jgi:hypothetical protein